MSEPRTMQAYGEFELLVFGDDVILNQEVEDWPLCDALLTWHSDGFPLRKARSMGAVLRCGHASPCVMQDDAGVGACHIQISGRWAPQHLAHGV